MKKRKQNFFHLTVLYLKMKKKKTHLIQSRLGNNVARCSLRGISVRISIRSLDIHRDDHQRYNDLRISSRILRAPAAQCVRVSRDQIRPICEDSLLYVLHHFVTYLHTDRRVRAGPRLLAGHGI